MTGPCTVPNSLTLPHVEVERVKRHHDRVIVIVDAANLGTLPKGDSWIFCTNGERKGLLVKFGTDADDIVWYGGLSARFTIMPAEIKGKLLKHPVLTVEATDAEKVANDVTDLVNKLYDAVKEPK